MNVEAWLKSDLLGIFKAPELKRVPIAALKRFNTIHEHLQALKDLQQISNYLSARGIHFEDQKIILPNYSNLLFDNGILIVDMANKHFRKKMNNYD